jgi:hypothetical protein
MGKSEKTSYAIDQEDGPSLNHCITPHWKEKPWLYLSELNNICFIHPPALKQFLKQTWSLWFPFWVVVITQKVCHVTQHIYNQHYDIQIKRLIRETSQMTHAMFVPMEKLQLTGQNLVQVFNFRVGCFRTTHFCSYQVIQHNLKLKTRSKQLLGYLPLDITLPDVPGVSRFQ